jgi:PAS domain-containing protein
MLKKHARNHTLKPILLEDQGIHWSHQRLLAIASQLSMLLIGIALLTNIIITLGERRLQEEWATQRYSELQTIGTLLSDKVSFQQFRTLTFANGELLRQYLDSPSESLKQALLQDWQSLNNNSPELLAIALFGADGEFQFSTNTNFGGEPLPRELLGSGRNMGGSEIYTSPLQFSPIDGNLEPFMYQLAWLENPDQSIRGYLVIYNSMRQMLDSVKPAFANNKSPMLMFDPLGVLYAGLHSGSPLPRMPETIGSSIRRSYPGLWRQIAMSNFGQFHGEDATFVYLKVELTTQYETRREYFLLSYVLNADIAARFAQWQTILVIGAIFFSLLGAAVVVLSHMFKLEQRSRNYCIELANSLFNSDIAYVLANEKGRVISANARAAKSLLLPLEELTDRSLQRTLHLENEAYAELMACLQRGEEWHGEIDLAPLGGCLLRTHIRQAAKVRHRNRFYLLTLEDVSELNQSQTQAFLSELLCNSAVATALTDAGGELVKTNASFDKLLQLNGELQHNLACLLENDLGNQWQRILQQIGMQGQWQGQILWNARGNGTICLQATLKGHQDTEGEIDYLICTLEQAQPRSKGSGNELIPHRSAILVGLTDLERYFNALPKSSHDGASLMLIDISPLDMLSHMSDIGQLEKRQQDVEMQLLLDLPNAYQMSHWQLGKLVIILPATDADQTHKFALHALRRLQDNGLGEGISVGIASYQIEQTLEQFLANAEVALKRAKQNGEQQICQAFTRQHKD